MAGWIAVDLDGTLAEYTSWDNGRIGKPVPLMLARVKKWIEEGKDVRIFTARVSHESRPVEEIVLERIKIESWCKEYIGKILPITCCKDFSLIEIWDDRSIQIEKNTGRRMDGED